MPNNQNIIIQDGNPFYYAGLNNMGNATYSAVPPGGWTPDTAAQSNALVDKQWKAGITSNLQNLIQKSQQGNAQAIWDLRRIQAEGNLPNQFQNAANSAMQSGTSNIYQNATNNVLKGLSTTPGYPGQLSARDYQLSTFSPWMLTPAQRQQAVNAQRQAIIEGEKRIMNERNNMGWGGPLGSIMNIGEKSFPLLMSAALAPITGGLASKLIPSLLLRLNQNIQQGNPFQNAQWQNQQLINRYFPQPQNPFQGGVLTRNNNGNYRAY